MTSEISDFETPDSLTGLINWALETSIWNGRPIHWTEASDFHQEVQSRILHFLSEQSNAQILQAGFSKSAQKFWKNHKTEILLGASIAAAFTTIAIIAACSAGGAIAAAVGSKALNSLTKTDPPLPKPITQTPAPPKSPPPIVFSEKGVAIDNRFTTYNDILNNKPPEILANPLRSSKNDWIADFLRTVGRGIIDEPSIPLPTPYKSSSAFSTLGPKQSHYQIGGINGINTEWEGAASHANYIASLASGQSIDWVHNQSHGPIIDVVEVLTLNFFGNSQNTSDLLRFNWTAFHEKNAERPHAKYLQVCHSQGAIHVRNTLAKLPKEIRDRVIVVAIAPAAVVPRKFVLNLSIMPAKKIPSIWESFLPPAH